MRILIHDYGGYAFIADLSVELARRGHTVRHLYFGFNNTPKGDMSGHPSAAESLEFLPLYTAEPFEKYSLIRRWRQEREYGNLLSQQVDEFGPDVVISAQTPLDAQRLFIDATLRTGARFIFWVQDLIGIATERVLRSKIPALGRLIGRYYIRKERDLLALSNQIVVVSEQFVDTLESWGIDEGKVEVIRNWASLDSIAPRSKVNPWSVEHSLESRFVFMYSGTLGFKHDPTFLVSLAKQFMDRKNARVVVLSEGPGARWLRKISTRDQLENIIVMDYVPWQQYPDVLATSEVLVAALRSDASTYSVPSKVLTYMSAGKPILGELPTDNPAAKLIGDVAAGFVVSPGNHDDFLAFAEELYSNSELRSAMGRRGREYAEIEFDIDPIADRFEGMLSG